MRALRQTKDRNPAERTLTAEELESALELLSTEADPTRGRRALMIELLGSILFGCLIYGLVIGLLVIWYDTSLGIGLLALAVLTLVMLAFSPESSVWDELTRVKTSLGPESIKVASEVWTNRTSWTEIILFFGSAVFIFGGAAWLLQGLIADAEVRTPALVVIAIGSIAFWVDLGFSNLRELGYYEQVDSIRHRFEEHAQAAGDGEPQIAVSEAELDVLARAEAHQTKLTVNESARQAPLVLERSYAVSITLEAFEALEQLHRKSTSDWLQVQNAIRSLQDNPRPSLAHPTTEMTASLKVVAGPNEVDYVVDDENRYVSVVGIGVGHANRSPNDG